MIRKLAFALTLLGYAGLVNALGLGEAEVTSSLNQPLRAEIELVSTKGLQAAEILPGLATREEFLKAGVDRVYFLSDLRFTVEETSSGNLKVVLTTNKPVREPFLNFLVEVIWPSGRLLREYALLIDPPVFSEEPAAPVAAPVTRVAPQPVQSAPQAPARGDRVAMPAPSSASPALSGTYGPTNSKDTLWEIAVKARPGRSVSPQQVMLAIQDLNPGAFIDGNINKLKEGQVLRLPSVEQIKARSAAAAINEVIAQNQALKTGKKPVVSAAMRANKPASSAPSSGQQDELKLVVADKTSEASSTANAGSDAVAGSGRGVDNELEITLEKLDKSNLENKELSGRVEDLEEQLETLQRLLTLKNDQLAGLQAQARQNELAKLEAEENVAESPEASPVADTSEAETSTPEQAQTESVADAATSESEAEQASEAEAADAQAEAEVAKDAALAKSDDKAKAPVQPVRPNRSHPAAIAVATGLDSPPRVERHEPGGSNGTADQPNASNQDQRRIPLKPEPELIFLEFSPRFSSSLALGEMKKSAGENLERSFFPN